MRASPGPGLPTATSSQMRTSGPPVLWIQIAWTIGASSFGWLRMTTCASRFGARPCYASKLYPLVTPRKDRQSDGQAEQAASREDSMNVPRPDSSRRQFLTGLAAAGAAATVSSGLAFAQQAEPTKPKRRGVIDVHHHFWAPDYLKAQDDWEDAHHIPHLPGMQSWSPEVSLAEMDRGGVQTAMLSLASISQGMWG